MPRLHLGDELRVAGGALLASIQCVLSGGNSHGGATFVHSIDRLRLARSPCGQRVRVTLHCHSVITSFPSNISMQLFMLDAILIGRKSIRPTRMHMDGSHGSSVRVMKQLTRTLNFASQVDLAAIAGGSTSVFELWPTTSYSNRHVRTKPSDFNPGGLCGLQRTALTLSVLRLADRRSTVFCCCTSAARFSSGALQSRQRYRCHFS